MQEIWGKYIYYELKGGFVLFERHERERERDEALFINTGIWIESEKWEFGIHDK
jgi:hypothetical protein